MTEPRNPEEVEAMHRIINGCLRPHAPAIAAIGFTGDVAVVLHEPGEEARATARAIGWDGQAEIFRLAAAGQAALTRLVGLADPRIVKWLGRKFDPAAPVARILLFTGEETVLASFSPFGGWSLEPSTTATS
jgi:hypothetical protein